MKKNALAAGLKAVADKKPAAKSTVSPTAKKPQPATVLIGAHFSPEVRRTLFLVQAEPDNMGKNLQQLLGEAINDLCAKYGKPQPYQAEN